jgi:Leucine-rich repeat (LRR) protein
MNSSTNFLYFFFLFFIVVSLIFVAIFQNRPQSSNKVLIENDQVLSKIAEVEKRAVKILDLSGCNLQANISFLSFSFTHSHLCFCLLQKLPHELEKVAPVLVEINLSFNQFSQVPLLKDFVQLHTIKIASNFLRAFPELPSNIAHNIITLDLSSNQINSLSPKIA